MHLFNKENIWSDPHASSIHPVIQTSTIILWKELFPRRGERRSKERFFNLSSSTEYSGVFHIPTRTSVFYTQSSRFPVILCYSAYRINSSTRILQEILQLQGSSCAGSFQQLFPVSPSILHGRIRLPDSPTAFQGHTAQAGFQ